MTNVGISATPSSMRPSPSGSRRVRNGRSLARSALRTAPPSAKRWLPRCRCPQETSERVSRFPPFVSPDMYLFDTYYPHVTEITYCATDVARLVRRLGLAGLLLCGNPCACSRGADMDGRNGVTSELIPGTQLGLNASEGGWTQIARHFCGASRRTSGRRGQP